MTDASLTKTLLLEIKENPGYQEVQAVCFWAANVAIDVGVYTTKVLLEDNKDSEDEDLLNALLDEQVQPEEAE